VRIVRPKSDFVNLAAELRYKIALHAIRSFFANLIAIDLYHAVFLDSNITDRLDSVTLAFRNTNKATLSVRLSG
jgi:hypothetical protein